jgi:hypothetical protein
LSSFGQFHGIAHGPIIEFENSFAPGNTNVISYESARDTGLQHPVYCDQ